MAIRTTIPKAKLVSFHMSVQDYMAVPGIHFSTLKHMRLSPLHYRHALENPPAETPAMLLGRATHTAVFEPLRFQLDYAVWQGDRRGSAYQQFAEDCASQGRSVLKEAEYETALRIRDAVRIHPEVSVILSKGIPEASIFWRHPTTGLDCKGRLDWVAGEGAILDLKTTSSIEPRTFAAHAWRMGYFHQLAMYQEGCSHASGMNSLLPCALIAVEQSPPHACRLYWLDPESLSRAWTEYQGWLEQVKACTETNTWPGPEPATMDLSAPAWATTDEEAVNFGGLEE